MTSGLTKLFSYPFLAMILMASVIFDSNYADAKSIKNIKNIFSLPKALTSNHPEKTAATDLICLSTSLSLSTNDVSKLNVQLVNSEEINHSISRASNSKLSVPSQASLNKLFKKCSRVKIISGGELDGIPLSNSVLLDTQDKMEIESLKQSLKITEDPSSFGFDLCNGEPCIELYNKGQRLAVLGFHHGHSIRYCKAWKYDATLMNGNKLLEWFESNGIKGPKAEFEENLRYKRRAESDLRKWMMAIPDCLRVHLVDNLASDALSDMLVYTPEPKENLSEPDPEAKLRLTQNKRANYLDKIMNENFSTDEDKTLALLHWFGSGNGAWTGFPLYETLPAELLLMIPAEQLIKTLSDVRNLSPTEIEGAARLLASSEFRLINPCESNNLDPKLRKLFLDYCLSSADKEKQARGKLAFGSMETI